MAVNNLFPARIAAGRKTFPQLGFNRLVIRDDGHARESWFSDDHYTSENPERIPFGPVDPEVGVIRIDDMHGNPRIIMMNYACHADIVCNNYEISRLSGVACRKVEEASIKTKLSVCSGQAQYWNLCNQFQGSGPTIISNDYAPMKNRRTAGMKRSKLAKNDNIR
jgi:hypothetical protein